MILNINYLCQCFWIVTPTFVGVLHNNVTIWSKILHEANFPNKLRMVKEKKKSAGRDVLLIARSYACNSLNVCLKLSLLTRSKNNGDTNSRPVLKITLGS